MRIGGIAFCWLLLCTLASQPTHCEILYSGSLEKHLEGKGDTSFDLDGNGLYELPFWYPTTRARPPNPAVTSCSLLQQFKTNTNLWSASVAVFGDSVVPAPLETGMRLSEELPDGYQWRLQQACTLLTYQRETVLPFSTTISGPWAGKSHKFIGLRILDNGLVRYGWVQVSGDASTGAFIVHDYAYESMVGCPIVAGRTASLPSIGAVTIESSNLNLRIANLIPGSTTTVQTTVSVIASNSWTAEATFVPIGISQTSTVAALNLDVPVFYRIQIQTE